MQLSGERQLECAGGREDGKGKSMVHKRIGNRGTRRFAPLDKGLCRRGPELTTFLKGHWAMLLGDPATGDDRGTS